VEVAKTPAEERRAAHLPHEPGEDLRAVCGFGRQEGTEFFGEIDEDRARFEYPNWLGAAAIEERGDLAVRVDADEAARELVALADVDQPCVIFGAAMTGCEQLLEHYGDFHAIRRAE